MSFLQRIRESFARFMQGRHGTDNLSLFTLITGLVCSLVASFTGIGLLSLIGMALYIWTIFRMFSRNNEKRWAENRKYIELTSGWKTKISQFIKRIKNRRDYRYFKCPNCKVLMRAKRGAGEMDISCFRCGFQYKKKV